MANTAVGAARHSLTYIIEAGKALWIAKGRVQPGQWESWTKSNLPHFSRSKISRYMAAAERICHVTNLNEIRTVRQAYLACGIITEPAEKKSEKMVTPANFAPSDFIAKVGSMRNFFQGTADQLPLTSIDEVERKQLSTEIQLLMDLFKTLQERFKEAASQQPSSVNEPAVPVAKSGGLKKKRRKGASGKSRKQKKGTSGKTKKSKSPAREEAKL